MLSDRSLAIIIGCVGMVATVLLAETGHPTTAALMPPMTLAIVNLFAHVNNDINRKKDG